MRKYIFIVKCIQYVSFENLKITSESPVSFVLKLNFALIQLQIIKKYFKIALKKIHFLFQMSKSTHF